MKQAAAGGDRGRAALALDVAASGLPEVAPFEISGQVSGVSGLALELVGFGGHLSVSNRAPIRCAAPNAAARMRLGPCIDLGVEALNCFATCRQGQRLGLFAGSGAGKSTLLSMLARYTQFDVAVIALAGECGQKLREFIKDDLGAGLSPGGEPGVAA